MIHFESGNVSMTPLLRHPAPRIILFATLFLAYAYISVEKSWDDDFRAYYQAGETVLSGRNIYETSVVEGNYLYSPFFALLMTPLSLLPQIAAAAVWFVSAIVTLVLALTLALYLNEAPQRSYSAWLRGFVSGTGRRPGSGRILVITVLLSARFWLNSIEHGQINLQLWGVVLAAMYCLRRRKMLVGSLLLGAAITTKIIPALFVFYCLLKRQYRFAALSGAWVVLFLLAPALVLGWEHNLGLLGAWFDKTVLAGLVEGAIGFRDANQSLPALVIRFFFDISANSGTGGSVNILSLPTEAIGTAVKICTGTLAGLIVLFTCRPAWRCAAGREVQCENLELSLVLLSAALMPALAWKAFFVASIMGYTTVLYALANRGPEMPRKRLKWMLGGSLVLHTATTDGIWGWPLAHVFQSYSCVTFSMILLYAAVVVVLLRSGSPRLRSGES